MFKGLTKETQLVLTIRAQGVASRFGTMEYLLPHHIVIAMCESRDCEGYGILSCLGIVIEALVEDITANHPTEEGADIIKGGRPPSETVKRILEKSAEMARNDGCDMISTAHILQAAYAEFAFLTQYINENKKKDVSLSKAVIERKRSEEAGLEHLDARKRAVTRRIRRTQSTELIGRFVDEILERLKRIEQPISTLTKSEEMLLRAYLEQLILRISESTDFEE